MMINEKKKLVCLSRDFSELPIDVLSVIVHKLVVCPCDLVWFGAVCSKWRSTLLMINKHLILPSSLPVLLFPSSVPSSSSSTSSSTTGEEEDDNNEKDEDGNKNKNITSTTTIQVRLYSLYDRTIHNFSLPVSGGIFHGSSHGWLVVHHNYQSVKLLNPLFSLNNEIQLPPTTTIFNSRALRKVVLSASPSSSSRGNEVVVMAIYGRDGRLSFCKPGDEAWTALPFRLTTKSVGDVIFYKGLFYAILWTGLVVTIQVPVAHDIPVPNINIIAKTPRQRGQLADLLHDYIPPYIDVVVDPLPQGSVHYFEKEYLVESSGELLLVKKAIETMDVEPYYYRTRGFQVLKLVTVDDEHDQSSSSSSSSSSFLVDVSTSSDQKYLYRWVKLKSLDGRSLFLGCNGSISLSVSDFPGCKCKPNCIYFTDDYERGFKYTPFVGAHDLGIYNLENKSIETHHHMQTDIITPRPIWIQPTL